MGDLGALCSANGKMGNVGFCLLASASFSGREALVCLVTIKGCAVQVRGEGSVEIVNGGRVIKVRISSATSESA